MYKKVLYFRSMVDSAIRTDTAHPKRALVLSGGGGRGAFQYGVFEQLNTLGWQPDVLVGTSIGSMNAAVWAIHGVEGVQRMWSELRNQDMHRFFRWSPWRSLYDRAAWKRTLEKYAPESELRRITTPLYLVAVDTTTGHPVVFTNSDAYDAGKSLYHRVEAINHQHLLASSSIPYVYAPTPIDHADHWDGALMYNSPFQPAVDSGAEEVLCVLLSPYHDLHTPGGLLPKPLPGVLGKAGHLLDLVITATFENDFEQVRKINRRLQEQRELDPKHRPIKAALIGPSHWLPLLDIVRYRRDRIEALRQEGKAATVQTWQRIQTVGWDSL